MWYQNNFYYFTFALCWEFLLQALIPCSLVLYLNLALYKRLKILVASEEYSLQTNQALRRSILRARLSLSITFIFVTSQLLTWIPFPIEVRFTNLILRFTLSWLYFRSSLGKVETVRTGWKEEIQLINWLVRWSTASIVLPITLFTSTWFGKKEGPSK